MNCGKEVGNIGFKGTRLRRIHDFPAIGRGESKIARQSRNPKNA